MSYRSIATILCFTIGIWGRADIDILTQIPALNGEMAQAGALTFIMDNNDFGDASTQNPVYIRITLNHGTRLCQTLVGPGENHDPIYLPVMLNSGSPDHTLSMEPNAVHIARWKAGESQIWIAATQSSSSWIQTPSGPVPPSEVHPVIFRLGLSARVYDSIAVGPGEAGQTNASLPYPRYASSDRPVSTLLCVQNTGNLQPLPQPASQSVLLFSPISFQFSEGVETAETQAGINPGPQSQINFEEARSIGREHDTRTTCELTASLQDPIPNVNATGTPESFTVSGGLRAACPIYPGAQLQIVLDDIARLTFPLLLDQKNDPIPGGQGYLLDPTALQMTAGWTPPSVPIDRVVETKEGWLSKFAFTEYQGRVMTAPADIRFTTFTFHQVITSEVPDFQITLFTPMTGDILDTAPYDGEDQALACTPDVSVGQASISAEGDQILITEVNYNAADNHDMIELYNAGVSRVDMSNWYLFNGFQYGRIKAGNQLHPGTRVVLHTNTAGEDTNTDWYLDRTVALENTGEAALFINSRLDQNHFMRAYVQWGEGHQPSAARAVNAALWRGVDDFPSSVEPGQSLGLVQTAWAPFSSCDWVPMTTPNPGDPNAIDLQALFLEQVADWPETNVPALLTALCPLHQQPVIPTVSTASAHR